MSTPSSDPAESVPPDPAPTPEEAAAQAAQQAAAEAAAALNNQIRDLATEIAKQSLLAFDPCTLRKGVVVSVQNTASPPTLTVTISGDTLEIPGVVYYEHYDPQASDVVHLIKQGTDLVAIGKVAEQHTETAFVDVTLATGFTHNGNSNGNLQVRRVWDHGVWRVDLAGGVNRTSGTVIGTLGANYRPTTAPRRTVVCARDAGGGSNTVKVDIDSTGVMTLVGTTTSPPTLNLGDTGSTTPNDSTHSHGQHEHGIDDSTHQHPAHDHGLSSNNANLSEHNHSGAVSTVGHSHTPHTHNVGSNDAGASTHSHSGTTQMTTPNDSTHSHGGHAHSIGSHHHDVDEPLWISFNGGCSFYR